MFILLRDPEEIVDEQLVLSPVAFFIATLLDGFNSAGAIQAAFHEYTGGGALSERDIADVVAFLDDKGFLLTPTFEQKRAQLVERFNSLTARPAHLAGKSYPENAVELRALIDGFFTLPNGPGRLPCMDSASPDCLRCLIVPHIDFNRGGAAYGHGYLRLAESKRPSVVFIFGVAHAGAPAPFTLTKKSFDTPLGTVKTDWELVERLAKSLDYDPFQYELAHRTEHSIEFQAVMLAYLYGTDVPIVPILCGLFPGEDETDAGSQVREIEAFLKECADIVAEPERDALVIAGADLAHVGKRFGDDFDIDDAIVQSIGSRDAEDLAFVTRLDPAGWRAAVMRDANERRVCGLNCIYSAMRAVEKTAKYGELVHYSYAPDPAGGIVSFANIVLK